jgi:hypothetical protein
MADIFQGSALPDINETETTKTKAPDYFTDYLTNVADVGSGALGTVDPVTGLVTKQKTATDLIAPLDALQIKGYGLVETAADAYKTGLKNAQTTATNAEGVSSGDISKFLNPYTQNVVNEMGRLQNQNVQRNLMPQLKGQFVGTGGLGGQRYANALGQTASDLQTNLTGQQYGALSSGYKSALEAAMQEAQLQNQVAQTQGTLAGKEQELGLTGAGAMTKAGAEQQAYAQAKLDAPLKNATNVAALLRGYQMPTTVTRDFKGPKAGTYGLSPLSQLTGITTLLGSGLSDAVKTNADGSVTVSPGWLSALGKKLGIGEDGSTTTDTTTGGGATTGGGTTTGGGVTGTYPHINQETGETYYTDQP